MPQILITEQISLIKRQLKSMIVLSKEEYDLSKNQSLDKDQRMSYFQQACEKLYKVVIHFLELKSGYNIRYHEELYDDQIWKKTGFSLSVMQTITGDLDSVHRFFYEGGTYPSEIVDSKYRRLYKFLYENVNK